MVWGYYKDSWVYHKPQARIPDVLHTCSVRPAEMAPIAKCRIAAGPWESATMNEHPSLAMALVQRKRTDG